MKRFAFILVTLFSVSLSLCAQEVPFFDEIRDFKKQDSLHFPSRKANLFVGSSSLRLWENIQNDFPGYKVINRGFGGSSLPDVIYYVNEIVFPYHPKQILIYCGENDLAASDTVSAQTVAARFIQLFGLIRNRWHRMPVVFISIKPSPSRQHLMPKMVEANRLIREFLQTQRKTKYIDVYSLMLTPDGKPREELFREDQLHMNAKGYAIWREAITPVLKK
jgi:lysophospholipase L1-like esterase